MARSDLTDRDVLARLRRVEGQVRGFARMVDGDRCRIDVLTHVPTATEGLQHVALGPFEDQLLHGVAGATAAGGPDSYRKSTEATAAVERLLKS